jgi:2-keto-4-pentenoate hydratase/2-oxohepta-3-ene-1,7-dioic acid hydratase in catechol pathway
LIIRTLLFCSSRQRLCSFDLPLSSLRRFIIPSKCSDWADARPISTKPQFIGHAHHARRPRIYGELIAEDKLARCVRLSRDRFDLKRAGAEDQLSQVSLLVPTVPTKVLCIGRNYREHAAELGNVAPDKEPLVFLKPPSCLVPHGADIELIRGSERVDYEGEIALVIGERCHRVDASDATSALACPTT